MQVGSETNVVWYDTSTPLKKTEANCNNLHATVVAILQDPLTLLLKLKILICRNFFANSICILQNVCLGQP